MNCERGGVSLSREQAAIVDHVCGEKKITVVSAGAGSGKTRTMVATVLHLIQTKKKNIDDFALITFTNKATDEMRERLEAGVEQHIQGAISKQDQEAAKKWFEQRERLSSAFIGTIHKFCAMLLKNFGYDEQIPRETEIIMARRHFLEAMGSTLNEGLSNPKTSLLFDPAQVNWLPYEMAEYLESIYNHIRARGRSVEKVVEETLSYQSEDEGAPYRFAIAKLLLQLEQKYNKVKQERGGVDTNDLLHKSSQLMKSYAEHVGKLLSARFKYIFVDEFQDTDVLQKEIIQSIMQHLDHVLVVGDRKQAIYGFRGSDDSILTKMAEENDVQPLILSASRRPTKQLHEVQTSLFKVMSRKYEVLEELLTLPPEGAHEPKDDIVPLEYIHVGGQEMDARIEASLQKVKEYLQKNIHHREDGLRPVEYRDICLLFRTNSSLERYLSVFQEVGIPVITDTGGGFFRQSEIVQTYYMLQAILRYPDDVSLYLVLGTPFLPVSPRKMLQGRDRVNNQLGNWLASDSKAKRWYDGIMQIRSRMKIDLVPNLLAQLYEFTGVREYYASKNNFQAVANLEKLIAWSREQMNAEALTLQQFFDRFQVAMLTNEEYDEVETGVKQDQNAVIFSTVHSAKGLEYPIVVIPETQRPVQNEKQTPKFFDIEGWGLDISLPEGVGESPRFEDWLEEYQKFLFEEEARVFYVAVTRGEHAVCFISGGKPEIAKDTDYRSWKDEILSARTELEKLGSKKVLFSGLRANTRSPKVTAKRRKKLKK